MRSRVYHELARQRVGAIRKVDRERRAGSRTTFAAVAHYAYDLGVQVALPFPKNDMLPDWVVIGKNPLRQAEAAEIHGTMLACATSHALDLAGKLGRLGSFFSDVASVHIEMKRTIPAALLGVAVFWLFGPARSAGQSAEPLRTRRSSWVCLP